MDTSRGEQQDARGISRCKSPTTPIQAMYVNASKRGLHAGGMVGRTRVPAPPAAARPGDARCHVSSCGASHTQSSAPAQRHIAWRARPSDALHWIPAQEQSTFAGELPPARRTCSCETHGRNEVDSAQGFPPAGARIARHPGCGGGMLTSSRQSTLTAGAPLSAPSWLCQWAPNRDKSCTGRPVAGGLLLKTGTGARAVFAARNPWFLFRSHIEPAEYVLTLSLTLLAR